MVMMMVMMTNSAKSSDIYYVADTTPTPFAILTHLIFCKT